jgi:hypothetical protein
MKPTHGLASIGSLVLGGLATGALVLISLWLTPAAPAFAAEPTPPPPGAASTERLQQAYQHAQDWHKTQADNLTRANDAAAKAQALIDAQKAKGVDTAALEAALATFKVQIAAAQASHDTAAGILATHAGFDAAGSAGTGSNVTDPAQARQTVTTARQSLNDAHRGLVQASRDLQMAIKEFRRGQAAQNRLAREQKGLEVQQANLDKVADAVTKAQAFIAAQKALGKDTAALDAALAAFQQQVAAAQASHTTAANLLSTHAGFDASGNVTDPELAHETLASVHEALNDAHTVLRQAELDLRQALKAYREANPPAAATPKP